jgi:hypothetical protein
MFIVSIFLTKLFLIKKTMGKAGTEILNIDVQK